jgi:hypothetical protein
MRKSRQAIREYAERQTCCGSIFTPYDGTDRWRRSDGAGEGKTQPNTTMKRQAGRRREAARDSMERRMPHWAILGLAPLLWAAPLAANAQEGFAALLKGQKMLQSSADFVYLDESGEPGEGEGGLVFEAFVESPQLASATLLLPDLRELPLEREWPDEPELRTSLRVESHLEMQRERPAGGYVFRLQPDSGPALEIPLTLAGEVEAPAPLLLHYDALQQVNSAAPLPLSWSPMGGTAQDFILLTIFSEGEGHVYQSGLPGETGAFNGTTTGTTLPAGLLTPGRDYEVELLFVKMVDVRTEPILAMAGFYKQTSCRLRTAALPGTPLYARLSEMVPQGMTGPVPVESVIGFRFSHPMSPSSRSILWTANGNPLSDNAFSYEWAEGNTLLLCRPVETLPEQARITWEVIASGFRDAAGFPATGGGQGEFTTASAQSPTPPAVEFVSLIKQRIFRQDADIPEFTGMWDCEIEADLGAYHSVRGAMFQMNANGRQDRLWANPWEPRLSQSGGMASKADLDRFYPNGSVSIRFDPWQGEPKTFVLSLGGQDDWPEAPRLLNHASLATIDPSQPLSLRWTPPAGFTGEIAVGAAWIGLSIDRPNGEDWLWIEAEDLIAGGGGCDLPAGTLQPGRSYSASLYFTRIKDLDETTWPGTLGAAGFESVTRFHLQTIGQASKPMLEVLHAGGGPLGIHASGGEPGDWHILETSSDLSRWVPVAWLGFSETGDAMHWDHDSMFFAKRWYRLRLEPGGDFQPLISLQGTVWADATRSNPLAGVQVGTSLDGRKTTTDATGRFFLITDTPMQGGAAVYTIQISQGSESRSYGPWAWGDQPRWQEFFW